MRAVILDVPEHWLEERRRTGADRRDEVWDGVLHMVPQPGFQHQIFATDLLAVLRPLAHARGFVIVHETGVFGSPDEKNYRVPDISVVDRVHASKRGIERRAEIAIEILSPDDESREKLPFYAACGIPEVWLIDPETKQFDIRWLDDGFAGAHDRSEVLGVQFETVAGPQLRISWTGGVADV